MNPTLSPDGRYVALERMSQEGPDASVLTPPSRDTALRVAGPGDDAFLGSSPDGPGERRRRRVRPDGRVEFYADGRLRRRSSLRLESSSDARAHLWLGAEATGGTARVDQVRVVIGR